MIKIANTWASMALAAATIALTAGCASGPRESLSSEYHEWAFTQARTTEIPSAAHNALENARQGDQIDLGDTSWGENSQFAIEQRYFAASGRPCFRGVVHANQANHANHANQANTQNQAEQTNAVVCRYSANRWVATRAIAQAINVVDHAQQPHTPAQQANKHQHNEQEAQP